MDDSLFGSRRGRLAYLVSRVCGHGGGTARFGKVHFLSRSPRGFASTPRLDLGARTRCQASLPGVGATVRIGHLAMDNVTRQLEDKGVTKFNKPFDKLMETLEQKSPLHEVRESWK